MTDKLPPPPIVFSVGDLVTKVADGTTRPGGVAITSPNGVSLVVCHDGLIHGHVAAMPMMYCDGAWRVLAHMARTLEIRPWMDA
jgi:hypothetical protein